jgi:hypothetical protein
LEVPVSKHQRKTSPKIARATGFGNPETMRQAQKVASRGAPETVAAMDAGDLSISAAAAIASQPKADQRRIVALPKDERSSAIIEIRKVKADQETDEQRAHDLRVFRALDYHVEWIARFSESPKETWERFSRVSADSFSLNLPRAIQCLVRLEREHPNEPRRPHVAP